MYVWIDSDNCQEVFEVNSLDEFMNVTREKVWNVSEQLLDFQIQQKSLLVNHPDDSWDMLSNDSVRVIEKLINDENTQNIIRLWGVDP